MPEMPAFPLIQDDRHFTELCHELGRIGTLAIDTEFVRDSTYYPRFCLLQVATPHATYCIDPLALKSLTPLTSLLRDPETCFVLHSARQDLEVLLQNTGHLPSAMLDTQIAAGLAGHHEQIGYASLVEEMTGIQLSKEQTRTDWSQRPLTAAQLRYAGDDVIYLSRIFGRLFEQLDELGRVEWWKEDSIALLSPSLYDAPNQEAWKKVKGLFDLAPQALARALTIAEWREETAKELDIPRSWVMRDEALLHWADLGEIPLDVIKMRNASRNDQRKHAELLLNRLAEDAPIDYALTLSQGSKGKADPARKALIKRLSERNQACADDLGISASVLASRKDLETLLDHPERSRLLKGWRHNVIGADLHKIALEA